ncbi:unnamed protein product [Gongylonema pulchrum]|uniref:non-specific serine/threonine protein kinase n=1 Tax=Gongylonema pulchrum TaxID=637853 RepID=A0A183EEX6_9BILA|nr:unnamed protein product [Gongylonema pulchrum]
MSFLPHSHPNIVHMYKAFTDRMPILEDAYRLYPEALPTNDFFELVVDEPKTLFIVMKRYRMTLREYVLTCKRNFWIGRVMFGQLLEAIVYLHDRRISHRDIKSDNILLDFDTEEDVPHLVLSDFGCALATGTWKVRYHSDTVDLGGNLALRAPEVRCARPDPNQWVDFRMADLWAAATIGYEIFTRINPFYSRMRSDQYAEFELPSLPKKVHYARPNPHVAANVLSISLFRFGDDLRKFFYSSGFDETLFGKPIIDLTRATSRTLKMLGQKMIAALNGFTMLFAAETILARNIHPRTISAAELQVIPKACIVDLALNYFYPDDEEPPPSKIRRSDKITSTMLAPNDFPSSVNTLITTSNLIIC